MENRISIDQLINSKIRNADQKASPNSLLFESYLQPQKKDGDIEEAVHEEADDQTEELLDEDQKSDAEINELALVGAFIPELNPVSDPEIDFGSRVVNEPSNLQSQSVAASEELLPLVGSAVAKIHADTIENGLVSNDLTSLSAKKVDASFSDTLQQKSNLTVMNEATIQEQQTQTMADKQSSALENETKNRTESLTSGNSQESVAVQSPLSEKFSVNKAAKGEWTAEIVPDSAQNASQLDLTPLLSRLETAKAEVDQPKAAAKQMEEVAEPIVQAVKELASGQAKKITLQIAPEKMGKIQISFEVNASESRLEFKVQSDQTRQLLESVSKELEQILQKQELPQKMSFSPVTAVNEQSAIAQSASSMMAFHFSDQPQQHFLQQDRTVQRNNFRQQTSKEEINLSEEISLDNGINILV